MSRSSHRHSTLEEAQLTAKRLNVGYKAEGVIFRRFLAAQSLATGQATATEEAKMSLCSFLLVSAFHSAAVRY